MREDERFILDSFPDPLLESSVPPSQLVRDGWDDWLDGVPSGVAGGEKECRCKDAARPTFFSDCLLLLPRSNNHNTDLSVSLLTFPEELEEAIMKFKNEYYK